MIDTGLSIHPIFSLWIIITVVIVLLVFMIWKEWQRKIKYRYVRIVAVILLSGSILGFLLQPVTEREGESDGFVLLTPHYKASTVDSLLRVDPKLTLLRTADALPYRDATLLDNFDDLYQGIDLHFVLGDGLPEYIVNGIKRPFQFYKGELPIGIVAWQPPKNFKANRVDQVQGTLRSNGASQIKLIGPGGVEDSISFTQPGNHDFTLSLTPKQSGLFVYSVAIEDSGKSVTQKFPVEVVEEKKLNILFVQNYPTAETRYLKNFLIENGHALAVRSKISKDRFRYEYANRESLRIDRLSPEILNEFDLFFIDQESFDALSNNEKVALEESVKQGLGLLTLYSSKDNMKGSAGLSLSMKEISADTVRVNLGSSEYTFSVLPLKVTDVVEPITQSKERVLSGYVNKGAGRIAFQLLQETYRLILEGKKMDYASLWSPLVERAARTENSKFKIDIDQAFPMFPDEPLNIHVIASNAKPQLINDGILIPLREDVVIDDYWHATTWAGDEGWHHFSTKQDSITVHYYVSNLTEWQSLRSSQRHRLNEAVSQNNSNRNENLSIVKELHPVSLLFFFIIFLLSAGFLWLVPKL
ncbi:MAG: hypothetical protein RI909_496 [Bacteroidota bacterium]|jgi:hypothetical protein